VFRLHLASFVVYNAIIGYTLPLDWRTSAAFAVLFTVAMGLHFVLSDRGLEEHYGSRFERWPPRLLLAGALLVGWALAALFAPTSSVLVSLLTAFLAGSILLNVFKEEIPSTRRSHFGWFVAGLAGYALLLGLVTATAQSSGAGGDSSGEAQHAQSRG
jgi:zinc transporter ZupT